MLEVPLGVFQQNNHHRVTTFVDEQDILDIYRRFQFYTLIFKSWWYIELIKHYVIFPCSWGLHNEHLSPMKLACNDIVITLQHMQIKYQVKSCTGNTWNAPNRFVIISSFYLQYFSENNVNIFVYHTTNAYLSKVERIKGYLVHLFWQILRRFFNRLRKFWKN